MSLTPVPTRRCTGCPHLPHAHACPECHCGVATLPVADHHTTTEKLDALTKIVETIAARVEYLIEEVLGHHETVRRVPVLEAEVGALRKIVAAHDEWERATKGGNGEVLE